MPSKNMLRKGSRRHSVRAEYRATRGMEAEPAAPAILPDAATGMENGVRSFVAPAAAAGMRLDAYLAQAIAETSRARVQLLIEAGQVRVDGSAPKARHRLHGGEAIEIVGEPRPEPLRAMAEDIPLDILYEDKFLAIVNKPAGMMVHAGAGATDDTRNKGTLVNALLYRMAKLSEVGGILRPGIVHRLDKQTSGAIVVAKDDVTHRKLSAMFAARQVAKVYIALLHGTLDKDNVTVDKPVARDLVRRTRMTTRRGDGRNAVSHFSVLERLATRYGAFTLVEVRIETGRTHQIRVHAQSLGHPVVGDTVYGAPRVIPVHRQEAGLSAAPPQRAGSPRNPAVLRDNHGLKDKNGLAEEAAVGLERNFLHAAHLEFAHPQSTLLNSQPALLNSQSTLLPAGSIVAVDAPLPAELVQFLASLRTGQATE